MTLTSVRFVLVGIANTLTGLFVIYGLKWGFGLHDLIANGMGYGIGLCLGFYLNGRWTFAYRNSLQSRILAYAIVVAVAYVANIAVVSVSIYLLHLDSYIAQATGVLPYALTTYFGLKFFVFSHSKNPPPTATTS